MGSPSGRMPSSSHAGFNPAMHAMNGTGSSNIGSPTPRLSMSGAAGSAAASPMASQSYGVATPAMTNQFIRPGSAGPGATPSAASPARGSPAPNAYMSGLPQGMQGLPQQLQQQGGMGAFNGMLTPQQLQQQFQQQQQSQQAPQQLQPQQQQFAQQLNSYNMGGAGGTQQWFG